MSASKCGQMANAMREIAPRTHPDAPDCHHLKSRISTPAPEGVVQTCPSGQPAAS